MNLAKKAAKTTSIEVEINEDAREKDRMILVRPQTEETVFGHELLDGLNDQEKTHVSATKTASGIILNDRSMSDREQTEPRHFWEISETQQGKREQTRQMKIEQEVMKQ